MRAIKNAITRPASPRKKRAEGFGYVPEEGSHRTGRDINEAAAWVKKRGGALGARGEDARGRYREGFVNWYRLPKDLRPD